MKFTPFKETNIYLGAGNNPNTEGIGACICADPVSNRPFIVGKVKVSKDALEKIQETGEIWIGVMGSAWAPLLITEDNPFTEFPEGQKFVPMEIPTKPRKKKIVEGGKTCTQKGCNEPEYIYGLCFKHYVYGESEQ